MCRQWEINGHPYRARTLAAALRLYLADYEREVLGRLYHNRVAEIIIQGGGAPAHDGPAPREDGRPADAPGVVA